jgi:hypothetical protein
MPARCARAFCRPSATATCWRRAPRSISGAPPTTTAWLQPLFLAEYERRIGAADPARADGKRLLAFPRLFSVARRRDG